MKPATPVAASGATLAARRPVASEGVELSSCPQAESSAQETRSEVRIVMFLMSNSMWRRNGGTDSYSLFSDDTIENSHEALRKLGATGVLADRFHPQAELSDVGNNTWDKGVLLWSARASDRPVPIARLSRFASGNWACPPGKVRKKWTLSRYDAVT